MTDKFYYKTVAEKLNEANAEDSEFEAKVLLSYYCGCSISEAAFKKEYDLSLDIIEALENAVFERKNGRPIQYIIGEWDFMDYTFKVGEGVLIPRPETELLCEYVIEKIKNLENPIVYDLCSGSGCIGLSIKKKVPQCDIYLVEKSMDALEYLTANASAVCKNTFLTIVKGDIFDIKAFEHHPKADAIVSNPPYISSSEIPTLQKEVQFEPNMALDGGANGLDFYRLLTSKWTKFLKEDGFMALECGEEQAEIIAGMFKENKFDSKTIEDYNHIKRFVVGRRNKNDI